jgi:O-antigen/teichoic acid export membrane protein
VSGNEVIPAVVSGAAPLAPVRRQSLDCGTVAPGLSLRSNFAWVLSGNLVYAGCQWGIVVALAKFGSSLMVGQFSLGLAIATPVVMFTNLHLRAVQATDARRLYSFREYLRLRTVMTLAAIAAVGGIVGFGHYERRTAMVILAVALAKGIEALSDIHYGLFQLNDRLDQTGRSMMLRGVLSVAAVCVGLYLTRDVFWACAALAVVWLAVLLLFDVRHGRDCVAHSEKSGPSRQPSGPLLERQWNLMCLALPLGIVTTLTAVYFNMPRYFIQARMGEHQLGIFSAMAYATVAATLVSDSLGNCAVPPLSRLYAGGRMAEFRRFLFGLLAAGAVLGLAGLAVAQFLGARLLTIVYSAEYAAQSHVFVLLMLGTAIHGVASMLNCGIMSARRFRIQVPMFALVTASSALACYWWVPTFGLTGGAAAMIVAAGVRLTLAAAVVGYILLAPAALIDDRKPGV